jgi:uncharacterized membrane protein YeaQ/YmgE (transglycosylase-associated protein family)
VGLLLFIIILAAWGFAVGGLARWAVPGPDPMSVWMTIALGLAGSFIGGLVARLLIGSYGGLVFSFIGAVLLLIAYRRWVQHRPITGPGAHRPPTR